MSNVNLRHEDVVQRGKITLECRLDPGFYNYLTGSETLALDRIAEALCGISSDRDNPFGGIYITLSSVVPVDYEVLASRIPSWLVINVTAVSKAFQLTEEFEKYMSLTAHKAMDMLAKKGSKKATIEIGSDIYILTES